MKKGLLSILAGALLVVGCQNYDDQFDSLESQINALASTVAGLSQVQSDLSSLAGTVNSLSSTVASLGSSIDTAVSNGLADITADIAALQAAVADVASSEDVTAIADAVTAAQSDLDDLLAGSNVFSGDVIINNVATLKAFHGMGTKLAIINGSVDIDVSTDMDVVLVQEMVDNILTVTKGFDYKAAASTIAEVTFNNLSGVATLTVEQSGGYQFQGLVSAGNVILKDTYKSKISKIDFRSLTTVTSFKTQATPNTIDFNKATELHLTSLVYYPGTSLTLKIDEGGQMPLAIDDIDADGDQKDIDLTIEGPSSLSISNLADGVLSFANVADLTVNGFGGTITVGAGIETFKADSFVTGSTLTATDLVTLNITGALDADSTTDKSGPTISLDSKADLESVTIAGKVKSVSLQGNNSLNSVVISGTVDGGVDIGGTTGNSDLTTVTLTGSSIAGTVNISNNDDIESLTIDTTFVKATASGSVLDGIIVVSENDNMTSLTVSSDKIEELTINGNDELATLNFTGVTTIGATGTASVTIKDNNLIATKAVNLEDATSTTAANGAVGKALDLGSFNDGTTGMKTLKTYLAAVLADTDSKAYVAFDSVETFDDEETAAADESSDVTSTSTTAVASTLVLKLSPNTADAGDPATKAKRTISFNLGDEVHFNANGVEIIKSVTIGNNLSSSVNDILTDAALDAADAAGVTMTATAFASPRALIAFASNSSAAENSATAATTNFTFTVSDSLTLTIDGQAVTVTATGVSGTARTATLIFVNALVEAWNTKFAGNAAGTASKSLARWSLSTRLGKASDPFGARGVVMIATAKDRGTRDIGAAMKVSFSAGKYATDSSIGYVIGNDQNFTKSTADNIAQGSEVLVTFTADTAGDLLSEIGQFGDGNSKGLKSLSWTGVTAGPGAEELSTTYSANSTASNATTSTNVYPHESRLDVVLPEEANAAAASNAVSYTRVHWLG